MNVPETERELFSYLCSMTRDLAHTERDRFTTQGISQALTISRNLASHYLNELVRNGLVVKAGTRPVYYFSRRDLERVLQTGIDRLSWSSVDELLSNRAHVELRDFERAVGYDLSLGSSVEKLKAAVKYPPQGLPVLICGDKGTGKTLLSTLMCEYGKRVGALAEGARTVIVNCSDYTGNHAAFAHDLNDDKSGWLQACAGGVVAFRDVERLSPASASLLLRRAAGSRATGRASPGTSGATYDLPGRRPRDRPPSCRRCPSSYASLRFASARLRSARNSCSGSSRKRVASSGRTYS